MTRHDIRIRRKQFGSNRIMRHKDYGQLMSRHKKVSRLRNFVTTILIIIILFILITISYLFITRVDDLQKNSTPDKPEDLSGLIHDFESTQIAFFAGNKVE